LVSYGLVLKELGLHERAITILVESTNSFPYNWSAWLDLTTLIAIQNNSFFVYFGNYVLTLQGDEYQRKIEEPLDEGLLFGSSFARIATKRRELANVPKLVHSLSEEYLFTRSEGPSSV
jgi:hypothetical protein